MLPPSRVQIKRKRTDDPVEILRVHDELAAGRNAGAYVFKRQRVLKPLPTHTEKPAVNLYPRAPTIGVSKPGDELKQPSQPYQTPIAQAVPAKDYALQTKEQAKERPIAGLRRFHMTRPGAGAQKLQGRKESIATFHERKPGAGAGAASPSNAASPSVTLKSVPTDSTTPIITAPTPPKPQTIHALQHLRGKASVTQIKLTPVSAVPARKNSPAPIAPLRGQRMASGQVMPINATQEQLDREMQAHTLRQIAATMAEDDIKPLSTPTKQANGATHRYTPKSTLRLRDRHPEIEAQREESMIQKAEAQEKMDVDMDEDEEDFIVETYVRVPVEQLGIGNTEHSVGLLVLEGQVDLEEFYGEEDESDSDLYDEEEDENAENHPRTEYPDEEVGTDDEFGINPYQYRNRNASDNEEYDSEDARFSDGEMEKKEPWMKNKWREAYGGRKVTSFDSDGEEEDEWF